jgi:hypothetical protein
MLAAAAAAPVAFLHHNHQLLLLQIIVGTCLTTKYCVEVPSKLERTTRRTTTQFRETATWT